MTNEYTYFAFISYKREDEKWARWLQHKLEHYKLPASIRKANPALPEKARPVFKDTTDLAGGVLEKAIKEALQSSKYLIVICSPRAAQSPWVCKEVQEFIDSGREEYIIPFIIDGEPHSANTANECFPQSLRELSGERELLGININEMGRDAAAIKVAARMFELHFDSLWQRYSREKNNKRLLWGGMVATLTLVLIVINGFFTKLNRQIDDQSNEIISKNTAIEIGDLTQKISLLEVAVNQGDNFASLLQLKQIRKSFATIIEKGDLSERLAVLEQQCINNIKQYPINLVDIRMGGSSEQNQDAGKQLVSSDICDVSFDLEYNYIIKNKKHQTDTVLCDISTPMITQDGSYLVYSAIEDNYGTLYFYDIINNTFIEKFKSTDLWLWYPSQGGVVDISHDNRLVLYHHLSRGRDEHFIVDVVGNKLISRNVPYGFAKLSPDKRYLLAHEHGTIIISYASNGKEYCRIGDSIFENAEWANNNLIKATKGEISTFWEINHKQDFHSINISTDISGRLLCAECSSNGRYIAAITDTHLHIWDIATGTMICKHKHYVYHPSCLTFSYDCEKIAYIGVHGYAGIYNITNKSQHNFLELAVENSNAGRNYQVDFICNDRLLVTYEKDRLDFYHSLYSLNSDSIILREHKIFATNNTNIILDGGKDTFYLYTPNEHKLLLINPNAFNIDSSYRHQHTHTPTWLRFDEDGLLHVNGTSADGCDMAERYVCDSLYKVSFTNSQIIVSKQNLLDKIDKLIDWHTIIVL